MAQIESGRSPAAFDAKVDSGKVFQEKIPVIFHGRIANGMVFQIHGHEEHGGGAGGEEEEEEDEGRPRHHHRPHVVYGGFKHGEESAERARTPAESGDETTSRPTTEKRGGRGRRIGRTPTQNGGGQRGRGRSEDGSGGGRRGREGGIANLVALNNARMIHKGDEIDDVTSSNHIGMVCLCRDEVWDITLERVFWILRNSQPASFETFFFSDIIQVSSNSCGHDSVLR